MSIGDCRDVVEGTRCQGVTESIQWTIVLDPAPEALSVPTVTVYDVTNLNADVTSVVMPAGSVSVVGASVTLPMLQNLELGRGYRVSVEYTDGTNTLEAHFDVICI